MNYYSQLGQDEFVDELLSNKENGFFVEVGANNGLTHSNTFFFEKYRSWDGVCIEPQPDIFLELKNFRACRCIQAAIGLVTELAAFTHVSGPSNELSGFVSCADHNRIEAEIKAFGGTLTEIQVPVVLLSKVLQGINRVDYLSVDVEGAELDVLQSIDFSAVDIAVISVEDNKGTGPCLSFLYDRGYRMVKKLEWDTIYARLDLL